MSIELTYNDFLLRDIKRYPIGLSDCGEDVNPEPGKCNNFNNRFKKNGPKKSDRRYGEAFPIYILQHNTVGTFQSTAATFIKNESPVSANYVIDKNGELYRFVSNTFRAYHAGSGSFTKNSCLSGLPYNELEDEMNSWSFGIENVNSGNEPYTAEQIRTNVSVCQRLADEFSTIDTNLMVGHSDWAPGRKIDPNPYFPWQQFANAMDEPKFKDLSINKNFGIFPRKTELDLSDDPKIVIAWGKDNYELTQDGKSVQMCLQEYGYHIPETELGKYGKATRNALLSFQLHFFGEEILSNEFTKMDWENVYNGKNGTVLCTFNENHQKCLDDILDQFSK